HAVKATPVDLEPEQRSIGSGRINAYQMLHGSKVADPAQQAHRHARGAARSPGDLGGTIGTQVEPEDPRAAADNQLELRRFVEDQRHDDIKTLAQRSGDQPRPRRRTDQGERRDIDADRPRPRSFADDQVELEILHCGIKDFLDRRGQPMELVDKEHIARLEIGQERGKIAAALDDRARGGAEAHTHLARDMKCASVGFPNPGGPERRTWSRASPPPRAALMKMRRLSHHRRWPTNSARVSGLSEASAASCSPRAGSTMRDTASFIDRAP